jgi:hypothetical protein
VLTRLVSSKKHCINFSYVSFVPRMRLHELCVVRQTVKTQNCIQNNFSWGAQLCWNCSVHPAINIIQGDGAIWKYWEEGPIAVAGLGNMVYDNKQPDFIHCSPSRPPLIQYIKLWEHIVGVNTAWHSITNHIFALLMEEETFSETLDVKCRFTQLMA